MSLYKWILSQFSNNNASNFFVVFKIYTYCTVQMNANVQIIQSQWKQFYEVQMCKVLLKLKSQMPFIAQMDA